jgi:Phytanoyl-CoA dioxygenase (PhyH)
MVAAVQAQSLLEQVQDMDFWRSLNPGLSVAEDWSANPPDEISLDAEDLELVQQDLLQDGYFQIDAILPEAEIMRMAIGIDELVQQDLLPVFAFVYDEFWRLRQRMTLLLTAILGEGYLQFPDFWAWYIPPIDGHAGWGQHRDRGVNALRADGMPNSMTLWLPLTDATPANGCMYMVPACYDPNYPDNLQSYTITNLQSVRALPAPAGSVLGWNQNVLHWGGCSSRKAMIPRISIAWEFQRGDIPPQRLPMLSPTALLTFPQRLSLIGQQIAQYQHMYHLSEEWAEIAEALQLLSPLK